MPMTANLIFGLAWCGAGAARGLVTHGGGSGAHTQHILRKRGHHRRRPGDAFDERAAAKTISRHAGT